MFKSRDTVLALDLGSASLKAVELEALDKKAVLRRAASLDLALPTDGDREGRADHRARIIAGLGELLRGMGIQPSKVRRLVSCLPGSQVAIKQIRCPALPDGEIRSALVFEARKHLPVEGEVLMDFQILARRPEDLDVLLVVTTKQAVVNHLAVLEACGLKGGLIEAPALAQWNAYLELAGKPAGEAVGFLHIGASATTVSFFQESGLFLTRDIPIAGDHFTDDAREKHGWDFPQAERAKLARGLFGAGTGEDREPGAGSAGTMTLELESENQGNFPSLRNLAREIQRSIRFYLKESGQARIGALVLAGGSAAGSGLEEYLGKELGMPVAAFDPMARLENGDGTEAKVGNRRQFAQAVGMALRGAHEFFPHRFK